MICIMQISWDNASASDPSCRAPSFRPRSTARAEIVRGKRVAILRLILVALQNIALKAAPVRQISMVGLFSMTTMVSLCRLGLIHSGIFRLETLAPKQVLSGHHQHDNKEYCLPLISMESMLTA